MSKKLVGVGLLLTLGIAVLGWGGEWISPAQLRDAGQSVSLAPPFWIKYWQVYNSSLGGPTYFETRFVPADFSLTYPFKILALRGTMFSGTGFEFIIYGSDHTTPLHTSPTQTGTGSDQDYTLPTPITISSATFDVAFHNLTSTSYPLNYRTDGLGHSYYSWDAVSWNYWNILEALIAVQVDTTTGGGPGPGGDYDAAITDWFFDPQSSKLPFPGVDNLPVCQVTNQGGREQGSTPGPVTVNCWIYKVEDGNETEVYSSVAEAPQLAARATDFAKFWDPFVPGSTYHIIFEIDSTSVPKDGNYANNRWEEYIETVLTKDIAVMQSIKPVENDTLSTDTPITPEVMIVNTAIQDAANFYVYFKAGAFTDSVLVPSLAAGAGDTVQFNSFTPASAGPLTCQFISALAGDEKPANDTAVVNVVVMLGVGETKPALPNHFGITAVTPNPFSTTTSIEFQLPVTSVVSLRTYDVSGNLVKTLVNGRTEAGVKTAVWDGRDNSGRPVPKGVYFVRMDTPEYSATQKLILIR